jgi:hypothetical protein
MRYLSTDSGLILHIDWIINVSDSYHGLNKLIIQWI